MEKSKARETKAKKANFEPEIKTVLGGLKRSEVETLVIKTTTLTMLGVFFATGVFLSFIELFIKSK